MIGMTAVLLQQDTLVGVLIGQRSDRETVRCEASRSEVNGNPEMETFNLLTGVVGMHHLYGGSNPSSGLRCGGE